MIGADELDVARRTLETLRHQDQIKQCTDKNYANSGCRRVVAALNYGIKPPADGISGEKP